MHRFFVVALGFLLFGGGFLMPASGANAHVGTCDDLVIDQTSDRVLDVDRIMDAAETKQLEEYGATIRIRALNSAPGGDLGNYVDEQLRACKSWQLPGSGVDPKGNLIVLVFSMDRQSFIYYGAAYKGRLDSAWNDIRTQDMNSNFKSGNFDQGILQAEQSLYEFLSGDVPDSSGGPSGSSETDKAGGVFLKVLTGLVLLAVFGGLIFGFLRLRKLRRQREYERQQAQARAIQADNDATIQVGALDLQEVELSYSIITNNLNDVNKQELDALLATARQKYKDAIGRQSVRSDSTVDFDLVKDKLTTDQYETVITQCETIVAKATAAADAIAMVEQRCGELHQQIEDAPATLARLEDQHGELSRYQRDLTEDDYKHDESQELDHAGSLLYEANTQIASKNYGQALDELQQATRVLATSEERLHAVRVIQEQIMSFSSQLSDDLAHAREECAAGNAGMEHLQQMYHSTCWHDLTASQKKAEELIATAEMEIHSAEQASSMQEQQWQEAQQLLDQAQASIADARTFPSAVSERQERMAHLSDELGMQLTQLEREVQSAESTVDGYKGKHASRLQALGSIAAEVRQLQERLQSDKPELVQIETAAAAQSQAVADILRDAKRAHDAIIEDERRERQRRDDEERRRRDSINSATSMGVGYGLGSSSGSSFGGGGFDSSGGGGGGSWGDSSGGGGGGSW